MAVYVPGGGSEKGGLAPSGVIVVQRSRSSARRRPPFSWLDNFVVCAGPILAK